MATSRRRGTQTERTRMEEQKEILINECAKHPGQDERYRLTRGHRTQRVAGNVIRKDLHYSFQRFLTTSGERKAAFPGPRVTPSCTLTIHLCKSATHKADTNGTRPQPLSTLKKSASVVIATGSSTRPTADVALPAKPPLQTEICCQGSSHSWGQQISSCVRRGLAPCKHQHGAVIL